jgi:NAD(P)-dependent dehydrogenase (short-subunit alcohol dehydrogenase family)
VAISDVSVAELDETASLLAGCGADAQRAELDVSDRVGVGENAAVTAEHFGVVHQFCNNAGIAISRSALETEYADYQRADSGAPGRPWMNERRARDGIVRHPDLSVRCRL